MNITKLCYYFIVRPDLQKKVMTRLKIYQWKIAVLSKLINIIWFPIWLVFAHEVVNKMGLRSLRDERYDLGMEHCRGRLLDIGRGNNQLVKNYGHDSIGVDVYDFGATPPWSKTYPNPSASGFGR